MDSGRRKNNPEGPEGELAPLVGRKLERRMAVLYAIVSEYIRTGQPAGSRTLTESYGLELSPATVRAVLKELEEEGFLMQPHTSAGRIPTERALRVYIDALMEVRRVPPEKAERIRSFFSERRGGRVSHDFAGEVGALLSDLSGAPSLVLQTRSESRVVQKIRFITTSPGELLAVVVLDDGSVENRFIRPEYPPDASTLERLHNLLDEAARGRSLTELRTYLMDRASKERDAAHALGQLGDALVRVTLSQIGNTEELIVSGRDSLLDGVSNPDRMRQLLVVLEDRERLIRLLDRVLGSERVQVFLGGEATTDLGSALSLVAAGFGQSTGVRGALGVLGPAEMDYPGLVPLVEAMARSLEHIWRGRNASTTGENTASGSEAD